MKAKLVVFDIAGTTLNDREDTVSAAFLKAIDEHGIDIGNTDIRWVMGYRKIEAIEMLLESAGIEANQEKVKHIHDRFIDILNDHYSAATISEYAGISKLFETLHENGIKVALDTGFSASTTAVIVDRLGWMQKGLIDATVSSDEVDQGRPYPDMVHHLMSKFGINNPKDVIKVGDTPSDLMEGKNVGCGLTIGVTYGTHSKEELQVHPHDYLVSSVEELSKLILPQWTEKTV
jgi:phosphonatase-like hydrolase